MRLALQDPAALARHRQVEDPSPKPRGGVIVDISRKRVVLDGQAAPLTYKEFELLQYLVLHPGRVFSREHLLADVWGYDYFGGTRRVDVHIRRLRAKLGPEHESLIGTVRNVGYRFSP